MQACNEATEPVDNQSTMNEQSDDDCIDTTPAPPQPCSSQLMEEDKESPAEDTMSETNRYEKNVAVYKRVYAGTTYEIEVSVEPVNDGAMPEEAPEVIEAPPQAEPSTSQPIDVGVKLSGILGSTMKDKDETPEDNRSGYLTSGPEWERVWECSMPLSEQCSTDQAALEAKAERLQNNLKRIWDGEETKVEKKKAVETKVEDKTPEKEEEE